MKSDDTCDQCGRDGDDPKQIDLRNPSIGVRAGYKYVDIELDHDRYNKHDGASISFDPQLAMDFAVEILSVIDDESFFAYLMDLTKSPHSSWRELFKRVLSRDSDPEAVLDQTMEWTDKLYYLTPKNHPLYPMIKVMYEMGGNIEQLFAIKPIVKESPEEEAPQTTVIDTRIITDLLKLDQAEDQFYYDKDGLLHRDDDLPAIDGKYSKAWYQHGVLSRLNDKPSIEWSDGHKFWFTGTRIHRQHNMPAIVYPNGDYECYYNGLKHNSSGPSSMFNGYETYHLSGVEHSKEVWNTKRMELPNMDFIGMEL